MGSIDVVYEEGVAVITVSAPEVKNALTPEMGAHLAAACDEVDGNAAIGAAVIRGAAGTFCSGADRRRWTVGADQAEENTYRDNGLVYSAFMRVGRLAVPTIAAVRGAAVGAGINLMLASDLRVVADDARMMAGFLRIGLHPGGGFFTIAHRTAGREATAALGLFSEEMTGIEAAASGLAWRSVPDDEVEPLALELARRPARDPELAREVVRSFRSETSAPGMEWQAALHFERATQMWSQRRRSKA